MRTESGLTSAEAAKRLREHGRNEIRELVHTSVLRILLSQIRKNFVLYLLFGAVIISLLVGKTITAYTIMGVITLVIAAGFFQEYKADKSIKALKQMIIATTSVIRDCKETIVSSAELVPGDIILLKPGDRVPADCLVISATELRTNEAVLTGESNEIKKSDKIKENQLYMGTHIINGKCTASVVRTGMQTEFGKIAGMISSAEKEMPLQTKVNKIAKYMASVAIFFSVMTGLIMISRSWPVTDVVIVEVLIVVIALSVSAFPEGFPVVLISTLATGVHRMARKNAIVNRMSIIETLGETTVICADKTGTITKGEMTVRHVFCDNKMFSVSGVGYETGSVFLRKQKIKNEDNTTLDLLAKSAVLCNDASLTAGREYTVTGTPTESALLVLGAKAGVFAENIASERKKEMPFSSERKMMSVLCKEGGLFFAYAKGATEVMLRKCGHIHKNGRIRKMTSRDRKEVLGINRTLASDGLRVLCIAFKQCGADEKLDNNLVFLGLAAMEDPPRKEVRNAIKLCRKAGIDVKMITGDNRDTAVSIGREIGLSGEVMSGEEIDAMTDKKLSEAIKKTSIFVRVRPEHKMRIVAALKMDGEIVTMTGDGVNDAPALKEAHIGVAMGKGGTDVSREVADIILKDDNFATIVAAVAEGRTIFNNIRKFVTYQLSCNCAELLILFLGVLLGLPLPLLALQILFMNLVTDNLPAITLSFNPSSSDIMQRKPRKKSGILDRQLIKLILIAGTVMGMVTLGVFYISLEAGLSLAEARTTALLTLIFFEIANAFNFRSFRKLVLNRSPLINKHLVIASVISLIATFMIIYSPVNVLFETVPLGASSILVALVASFSIVLVFDALKLIKGDLSGESKTKVFQR
ncbi:MAG: cation-transporting P-type ATPase [Candidatus Aenigmatarchaeota archaeon]